MIICCSGRKLLFDRFVDGAKFVERDCLVLGYVDVGLRRCVVVGVELSIYGVGWKSSR